MLLYAPQEPLDVYALWRLALEARHRHFTRCCTFASSVVRPEQQSSKQRSSSLTRVGLAGDAWLVERQRGTMTVVLWPSLRPLHGPRARDLGRQRVCLAGCGATAAGAVELGTF